MSSVKPGRDGYPENWLEVRNAALGRAKHRCQCWGLCGEEHRNPIAGKCGIANGAWIVRATGTAYEEVGPLFAEVRGATKVALQVAHLNHTPADVREVNLMVLCPRCHTALDARWHASTFARRVGEAREQAGQLVLVQPAPSGG